MGDPKKTNIVHSLKISGNIELRRTQNYIAQLLEYSKHCDKMVELGYFIPNDERQRMSRIYNKLYMKDLFPFSLGTILRPVIDVDNWQRVELHAIDKGCLVKVEWSSIDYGILVNDKISHMGVLEDNNYLVFVDELMNVKPDIEVNNYGINWNYTLNELKAIVSELRGITYE